MADLQLLLATQDLVISRAQALQHGITKHAWDWRLQHGWQRVIDGVAVTHTGALSPQQRAWAAALHMGSGAALSGDALLHLLGFPLNEVKSIDVVVPHGRRVAAANLADGTQVVVHRARAIEQLRDARATLPSVSRHVAVLHAAAWASTDKAAEWRLAAMAQRRLSAPRLMRETLTLLPRLPRRALVRTVLDDVELGAHAGSELAFLRFVRTHRLPLPDALQVRVRTGQTVAYLDARYSEQRVTLEIDGAHHREVKQWDADALRTLRLAVSLPGERVVRLTTGNLRHDANEVARLLRELLSTGDA